MKINSNLLMGIFFIMILSGIFVILMPFVSSGSEVINTFLVYEDSASATSKTVTQGDLFNVVMVAYGHGEALQNERLELVGSTLIFQESVSGDKIETYTWLYTKTYTINTGILTPGTYTLRFTAKTATTQSVEYSDLQLTILPKEIPDTTKPVVDVTYPTATTYTSQRTNLIFSVSDDNLKSCTYSLNGASPVNVASLVNGVNTITGISSVTGSNTWTVTCKDYSGNTGTDSVNFNVVLPTPPFCGDGTCNGNETCSTCPTDCGVCPTNCTICKDSKPLDDSNYDYLAYLNKKTTFIFEEASTKNVEKEKSLLKDSPILISLILILGILMLLIVIAIAKIIKRKN